MRLINEIVLVGETDVLPLERYLSHFEMYLQAMRELDCDSGQVRGLTDLLHGGIDVAAALRQVSAPTAVQAFVMQTFGLLPNSDLVEVLSISAVRI